METPLIMSLSEVQFSMDMTLVVLMRGRPTQEMFLAAGFGCKRHLHHARWETAENGTRPEGAS